MNAILWITLSVLASVDLLLGVSVRVSPLVGDDPDDIPEIPNLIRMRRDALQTSHSKQRILGKRAVEKTAEEEATALRRHTRDTEDDINRLPDDYPRQLPMWPEQYDHHSSPTRLWGAARTVRKVPSPSVTHLMVWPDGDFLYGRPRVWGRKKRSVQQTVAREGQKDKHQRHRRALDDAGPPTKPRVWGRKKRSVHQNEKEVNQRENHQRQKRAVGDAAPHNHVKSKGWSSGLYGRKKGSSELYTD